MENALLVCFMVGRLWGCIGSLSNMIQADLLRSTRDGLMFRLTNKVGLLYLDKPSTPRQAPLLGDEFASLNSLMSNT